MKKLVIFLIAIVMLINVGVVLAADEVALEQRVNKLERQIAELQEALMQLRGSRVTSRTAIESGTNFGSGGIPGGAPGGIGTAGN